MSVVNAGGRSGLGWRCCHLIPVDDTEAKTALREIRCQSAAMHLDRSAQHVSNRLIDVRSRKGAT